MAAFFHFIRVPCSPAVAGQGMRSPLQFNGYKTWRFSNNICRFMIVCLQKKTKNMIYVIMCGKVYLL
jgi:hypothetical protein